MPLKRLKFTFDYCKSNIPSFILVLILIFTLDQFNAYYYLFEGKKAIILVLVAFCITFIFHGYGLVVTKDNINNGRSLPKLPFYKSFILGIKSSIIVSLFGGIQYIIFLLVSTVFNFPMITIEEGNISVSNIGPLFYEHNSIDTILFFIFIFVSLYLFTFFLEISLARLADKGSLREALSIKSIERCINTIGWGNYTADYTKLIITIAILSYLKYGLSFMVKHPIIDLIMGLLIFIVQYIGIGRIYKEYKDKQYANVYPKPKKRVSH